MLNWNGTVTSSDYAVCPKPETAASMHNTTAVISHLLLIVPAPCFRREGGRSRRSLSLNTARLGAQLSHPTSRWMRG